MGTVSNLGSSIIPMLLAQSLHLPTLFCMHTRTFGTQSTNDTNKFKSIHWFEFKPINFYKKNIQTQCHPLCNCIIIISKLFWSRQNNRKSIQTPVHGFPYLLWSEYRAEFFVMKNFLLKFQTYQPLPKQ